MKALLGVLICLVLAESECFAISGGPDYGTSKATTTGIYAALLVPTKSDNSLGLLSVTVPKTGLATGSAGFFRNGIFYPGTVKAIADPDSGNFTAVVDAGNNIVLETTKTSAIVVTFTANGSVTAKITSNRDRFSTASARLRGNAEITYATIGTATNLPSNTDSDGPVPYVVNGFKQADVQ